MNPDRRRFVELYAQERLEDQLGWYDGRVTEFSRARSQIGYLTAVLFTLSGLSAYLAMADPDRHGLWSVCAVVLPVMSTVLASYEGLYSFDQQAKLYADARTALNGLTLESPRPGGVESDADPDTEIDVFVGKVEAVLRTEQGQWGQLVGEEPEPPTKL